MDFFNLLGGDPSDNTFGSAPKIPLLRKPAAWKGFGVDQLSKRDTFKTDYTSGFTKSLNSKTTAGLSPTAMAGGMKGNLSGTIGKQAGSTLPSPKGGGFLSNNAGLLASGAIGGATSILSAYSDPNATAASKDAAAVSGLADTASSTLMSSGNPIAMVAGAAIKGIDMVGKPLFNSALYKGLANFDKNTNKAVTESSGFGGIGASAEGISKDVSDYKKFGSFGKATYFASGKMNRMKREADRNIKLQGEASKILNKNKNAVEAAAVGAGDATTRNMYEKYNPNMYDSIQFGKDGGKLIPNKLTKYDEILTDNKNVPFVHRLLTKDTRSIFVNGKNPSTHLMSSYGKLVMPQVFDNGFAFGKLKYIYPGKNMDSVYDSNNKIEFNTEAEAEDFAKNYKKSNIYKEFEKAGEFRNKETPADVNRIAKTSPSIKRSPIDKNKTNTNLSLSKKDNNIMNNDMSIDFGPLHIQGVDKGALKQDFRIPATRLFKSLKGMGFITPFVDIASDLKYTNSLTPDEKMSYEKKKRIELRKLGPSTSELENLFDNARYLKNGGKINVIVNGKLHKELHHMDMDDVTKKGVPVVTMEDGGEVVQHAEVERDEMILHLELTKKLEELKEEGSDDSMIEAGKILAYEIVKNTKDSKNKIIKNA